MCVKNGLQMRLSYSIESRALHLSPSRWRFAPLLLPALNSRVCLSVRVCDQPCMSYFSTETHALAHPNDAFPAAFVSFLRITVNM